MSSEFNLANDFSHSSFWIGAGYNCCGIYCDWNAFMSGYCPDCKNTLCICDDTTLKFASSDSDYPWRLAQCQCTPTGGVKKKCPLHDVVTNNYHSKSEQRRIEHMKEQKPDAPAREDIVEIPLTKGLVAIIDRADYEIVSKNKWYASVKKDGGYPYAKRYATPDERKAGASTAICLHRFLLNPKRDELVDHKNGNTLDNRRSNLRICNVRQNTYNTRKHIVAGKYKGVTFEKRTGRYRASITINNEIAQHIGFYDTAIEAAVAYDKLAAHVQGEFVVLNFPNAEGCKTIQSLAKRAEHFEILSRRQLTELASAQVRIAELSNERDALAKMSLARQEEFSAARQEIEHWKSQHADALKMYNELYPLHVKAKAEIERLKGLLK